MYKISITADTNDGDYITQVSDINEEILELIIPVIRAIANFKPYQSGDKNWKHFHNFPIGECHRDHLGEKSVKDLYGHLPGLEEFLKIIPYNEYGIHTIKSVEVYEITNIQKLL